MANALVPIVAYSSNPIDDSNACAMTGTGRLLLIYRDGYSYNYVCSLAADDTMRLLNAEKRIVRFVSSADIKGWNHRGNSQSNRPDIH